MLLASLLFITGFETGRYTSQQISQPLFQSNEDANRVLLGRDADTVRTLLGEPDVVHLFPATHNPTMSSGANTQDLLVWEYQCSHQSLRSRQQLYVCFDKDGLVYHVHGQR